MSESFSSPSLPPGWSEHYDPASGKRYYINFNMSPPQVTDVGPESTLSSPTRPSSQHHQNVGGASQQTRTKTSPAPPVSFAQRLYASSGSAKDESVHAMVNSNGLYPHSVDEPSSPASLGTSQSSPPVSQGQRRSFSAGVESDSSPNPTPQGIRSRRRFQLLPQTYNQPAIRDHPSSASLYGTFISSVIPQSIPEVPHYNTTLRPSPNTSTSVDTTPAIIQPTAASSPRTATNPASSSTLTRPSLRPLPSPLLPQPRRPLPQNVHQPTPRPRSQPPPQGTLLPPPPQLQHPPRPTKASEPPRNTQPSSHLLAGHRVPMAAPHNQQPQVINVAQLSPPKNQRTTGQVLGNIATSIATSTAKAAIRIGAKTLLASIGVPIELIPGFSGEVDLSSVLSNLNLGATPDLSTGVDWSQLTSQSAVDYQSIINAIQQQQQQSGSQPAVNYQAVIHQLQALQNNVPKPQRPPTLAPRPGRPSQYGAPQQQYYPHSQFTQQQPQQCSSGMVDNTPQSGRPDNNLAQFNADTEMYNQMQAEYMAAYNNAYNNTMQQINAQSTNYANFMVDPSGFSTFQQSPQDYANIMAGLSTPSFQPPFGDDALASYGANLNDYAANFLGAVAQ